MSLAEILNTTNELNTVDYIGTDKNSTHGYVDHFYEKEFLRYQDKSISLLEIGVHKGGSLYLWGKYFKYGKILGIDYDDKVRDVWKVLPNTNYLIVPDAYDKSFAQTLPNFDIIIDDGPHTLKSQIDFIELYLPKLNKGGIFIIEDVQKLEDLNTLKENTPKEYINKVELIDLRFARNRYDDLLFVIRN